MVSPAYDLLAVPGSGIDKHISIRNHSSLSVSYEIGYEKLLAEKLRHCLAML
jgi:hypothetical protein